MRVLVISQYYYPEPLRISELCEELVKRGHHIEVITGNPNYPEGELYKGYKNIKQIEEINSVTVHRCKIFLRHTGLFKLFLNYISFVLNGTKLIKRIKGEFDCVFIYQLSPIFSAIPGLRYGKRNDKPILLYCLDIWPESIRNHIKPDGIVFKIVKNISKRIYIGCNRIVVSSPSFSDYLSRLTGIDRKEIGWIPQHSSDFKVMNRREGNIEKTFFFIGNVGESQNLDLFLNAFSLIDKKRFSFHIVGNGSQLIRIKKKAEELGLIENVVFHGFCTKEQIRSFYEIADVCVLGLREEGAVSNTVPAKLQEYMSAGKPILGSIGGDAASIIQQARCGIAVEPENTQALYMGINFFLDANNDISDMGKNARLYYEKHFTVGCVVEKLESALFEMLPS